MCQLTALERDLDNYIKHTYFPSSGYSDQASSSIVECEARPPNNTIALAG